MLEKYKVTTFCAPPTIYRFMIQEDLSQYDLSSIQHCTTAGEPLNPEVYRTSGKELTGHRAARDLRPDRDCALTVGTFPWMKICPGSMGKPSPQFDVDIVRRGRQELPRRRRWARSWCARSTRRPWACSCGYYRDEELTPRLSGTTACTTRATLAWRDEWGYYWYVGRADDVIKSSGYRIGPFEVESALMEHPAVVETAITGVPDPVRGQIVKATIVLTKGYEPQPRN